MHVQWRQTSCCFCCTCYTTFSAPPRNYIHKCATLFCPAPNLFTTCNTAFMPRLAPLAMPKAGRSLFNWFQQSSNPIFQIPIVILSKKSITNLQLPPALSIMIMAVNETLKKTTFSPSFCMTVFQAQHSTTTNFTVPFFINASKQVFGCVIIKRNHLPPHPTPRLFCCEDDFILFRRVTEVTILFKFGVSSFLAQCTCWL